jgi:hypothetical protein
MKLVRTFTMIIALAGASTVYAQAPKAPATPEKKAPEADKKAPADKPAKEELSKAEVEKAEKFFNDFYDAVMKNQDACPKMATAINALLDKHGDWLKKMAESGKDMPQASKDKMQKKQTEMMGGMTKCKDDKDVQAAMQRFVSIAMSAKKSPPPATAAPKKN